MRLIIGVGDVNGDRERDLLRVGDIPEVTTDANSSGFSKYMACPQSGTSA
jgi:hypothetical protein